MIGRSNKSCYDTEPIMFEDEAATDVTCQHCGSVFQVTSTKLPVRDSGSIPCSVCGQLLMDWNGSRDYRAVLKKRGQPPESK